MSRDAAPGSHVVLSTDAVRERERLDYRRDIVCDTFVELECRAGADPAPEPATDEHPRPPADDRPADR